MSTINQFIIPTKPSNYWNFPINDDCDFQDDTWDLSSLYSHKRASIHAVSHLNFKLLSKKPKIIEPIKRYVYIRLGQVKLSTASLEYSSLSSKIIKYLEDKEFDSLEAINTQEFISFNHWLKCNYAELSIHYLANIAHTLLEVISIGQALDFPKLPKEPIDLECSIWEWWKIKQTTNSKNISMVDRSIPLAIWKRILQAAWQEKNILSIIRTGASRGMKRVNNARYAILIQAYTGLRISEVLSLKRNAISKDANDRYWLSAEIDKTEAKTSKHSILIPKKIYLLIQELEAITEELSMQSETPNYLFYLLSKPSKLSALETKNKKYTPKPLESGKYNSTLLRPFLKRNNIDEYFINDNNQRIRINSHCFRHTYANIAVTQKGVNAKVLQTHFKHLSLEMTMHYIYLHKEELKRSYIKVMMESNILSHGKEGERFKTLINEAKTVHNLEEVTEQLSQHFGVNPLPFGLCLYDFKRGHCPHLGATACYLVSCSDFITNKSFLKEFQHQQEVLLKQIKHTEDNGQVIESKKANFHLQKIEKIIQKISEE